MVINRARSVANKLNDMEGFVPMGEEPEALGPFLAAPAPGALALQVVTEWVIQKREDPSKLVVAANVIDSIIEFDARRPRTLVTTVSWMGPSQPIGSVTIHTPHFLPLIEQSLRAAAGLRLPLHVFVPPTTVAGDTNYPSPEHQGSLFGPRPPLQPGRLAGEARVLDTPDRFEVLIGRIDSPGAAGRKLLRRTDLQVSFAATQAADRLTIDYVARRNSVSVEVEVDDFVGILTVHNRPVLYTAKEAIKLPDLDDWHRADHRGREFSQWVYDRLNARWGA